MHKFISTMCDTTTKSVDCVTCCVHHFMLLCTPVYGYTCNYMYYMFNHVFKTNRGLGTYEYIF